MQLICLRLYIMIVLSTWSHTFYIDKRSRPSRPSRLSFRNSGCFFRSCTAICNTSRGEFEKDRPERANSFRFIVGFSMNKHFCLFFSLQTVVLWGKLTSPYLSQLHYLMYQHSPRFTLLEFASPRFARKMSEI